MAELHPFLGIVVCFWPIWLGIPFVIILSRIVNISDWRTLYIEKRMVVYSGIILIFSLIGFGWGSYFVSELPMVFAYINIYPEGYEENRHRIHQELWLRMVVPPSERDCYSSEFICNWADEILENSRGGYTLTRSIAQRWQEYILNFIVFGVTFGFGMAFVFNRLLKYRSNRQPALLA